MRLKAFQPPSRTILHIASCIPVPPVVASMALQQALLAFALAPLAASVGVEGAAECPCISGSGCLGGCLETCCIFFFLHRLY